MYLFSNKEIGITEYTNNSVIKSRRRLKQSTNVHKLLKFNGAKLSVAIARTLCSHHLDVKEFWFDIVMSIMGVRNIVAPSTDFKLLDSRLDRLRDFTKTTRIGETAQGIAYLFAQDILEYPFVIDFDYFFSLRGVSIPNDESTPDFVLQRNILDLNIGLLESKGTEINSSGSIKGYLVKGLSQCRNGEKLTINTGYSVEKKHVVCTEFSVETIIDKSMLHYVDPSKKPINSDFDDNLLRFHYASFFYLLGDFNNVKNLINGNTINFDKGLFDEYQLGDEKYFVFSTLHLFDNILRFFEDLNYGYERRILYEFIRPLSRFPKDYNLIGIAEKIINHLTGENKFTILPSFKSEYQKNESMSLFTDGIIVFSNKNNRFII